MSLLSLDFEETIGNCIKCLDHLFRQGFAESRVFQDAKGQTVTVALTARRSRLHPGTRYLARGLNGAYSTGGPRFFLIYPCIELVRAYQNVPLVADVLSVSGC